MSFRWSAFVGVAFAFIPTTGVIAEMHGIPVSDTIYVKWSGALDQSTLADTSILNEYVAQTYSESVNGASVQLAFVPRFNCSPIFSVRLSAKAAAGINDDLAISLTVDNVAMEFPAIVDRSESSREFSYDADRVEQEKLRALLDVSSRVSIIWAPAAESDSQDADATDPVTITFSLLGSKMSADAVEALCEAHEPIPY